MLHEQHSGQENDRNSSNTKFDAQIVATQFMFIGVNTKAAPLIKVIIPGIT